jgi:hypothetical protein
MMNGDLVFAQFLEISFIDVSIRFRDKTSQRHGRSFQRTSPVCIA